MQTREKFYFICEQWLSIDKGDCKLERMLPLSYQHDKTAFKYLLLRQTKEKLSDDHLWYSIFARRVQSSFTRMDRLTCGFVLLSMSMVMNIMYYGMDTTSNVDGLRIGPINLTIQQVSVGVITNLIIFPPTLLLVQLFRRIKPRRSHVKQLKSILALSHAHNDEKQQQNQKKQKKVAFKFPWWFKIVAYIISFTLAAVSLFFVIIKGVLLGEVQVTKWATSLLVSFFSSILVMQPTQVLYFKDLHLFKGEYLFYAIFYKIAFVTLVIVTLFRSFDDKNEKNNLDDDNNKINDWKNETSLSVRKIHFFKSSRPEYNGLLLIFET